VVAGFGLLVCFSGFVGWFVWVGGCLFVPGPAAFSLFCEGAMFCPESLHVFA
jgi:hypothetical protein